MKSNVKFIEKVVPLNGMNKGIAEMTYKQKQKNGVNIPTVTVNGNDYPYIHVRGIKVLFNPFGMAMYIEKTPIDAEVE